MVQREAVGDVGVSIRFKHGNHTIFLFVDPMKPFSQVQEDLYGIISEKYPDGLTTTVAPLKKTYLPTDASLIKFALPKNTTDLSQGWKSLNVDPNDTPAGKGLTKDNMIVGFAIALEGVDDDDVEFEVDFPSYDEEIEED